MNRARLRLIAFICLVPLGVIGMAPVGAEEPAEQPRSGGTFRMVTGADVDSLDPGQTYLVSGFLLHRVSVRTLVTPPSATADGTQGAAPVADLATTTGEVSDDGLTYTFRLRAGVRYPPGVAGGREVRSADIRYGIERGFLPSVANPYVGAYFSDVIEGDTEFAAGQAPHISGIDVSDPEVVTFRLRRPTGDFLNRLTLPLAGPVPEEYAAPHDAVTPSTYGDHFAATGPYTPDRHDPDREIRFVRNPNWDPDSDPIRQAWPDVLDIRTDVIDSEEAGRRTLHGEFDFHLDYAATEVAAALRDDPERGDQLRIDPSACVSYLVMNTRIAPFDQPAVRQAVNLAMDKRAVRQAGGGPDSGAIAGHILMPGMPGFEEAGGATYDPYATAGSGGDTEAAQARMREAGYPDGVYTGPPVRFGVRAGGDFEGQEVIEASLRRIGIEVTREVYDPDELNRLAHDRDSGLALFEGGWCWDYPDAITVIRPLFDGRLILPEANQNTSQLDDGDLNHLIDQAVAAEGPQRAELWAAADRRVMELAPVVPLRWDNEVHVTSARVRGYRSMHNGLAIGIDLGRVWLAEGS